jgi:SAM-dependent methyltransferase
MTSPATPSTGSPNATPPTPTGFPDLPTSFPEQYERLLVGPLFRPWADRLLDRVPLTPGSRVLDVACGTGIVARLARERLGGQGWVVGVDRNPAMLAAARAIEPTIDWREGDAADPPVAEGERFDAVLCHQGLQFFADKPAAARAMRRVLVPGGRVGIGVWRSLEENGLFHDFALVAERFLGRVDDARHSFPDADALARLLTDAGFADVQVDPTSHETRFELDPAVLARLNAMAVIGMSAAGKAMSDAERAETASAIVDASLGAMARYVKDRVIAFRTSANIATARA